MTDKLLIGHGADFHLGAGVPYGVFNPVLGMNTFTAAQRDALAYVVQVLAAKGCKYVTIPGDIFDTYEPKPLFYSIFQEFVGMCKAKGIIVIVTVGNHDRTDGGVNAVKALWRGPEDVNLHYVGGQEYYEDDQLVVADVVYDEWYKFSDKKVKVGTFHGIVPGVKLIGGFEPTPNAPDFPKYADMFMLGDIHLPQVLWIHGKPAIYPGCGLTRLNFGEKSYSPGINYYEIDRSNKEVVQERISTAHCSPVFVEASINSVADFQAIEKANHGAGAFRVYKLEGPAEIEQAVRKEAGQDVVYRYAATSVSGSTATAGVKAVHTEYDLRRILDNVVLPVWFKDHLKGMLKSGAVGGNLAGDFYLSKVRIKGFGPFKDAEVSFPSKNASVRIIGRVIGGSEADSNGAGKSMITDAVKCAMYGTTYRGLSAGWCVLESEAEVEVEWDGPQKVRVLRTIGAGTGNGKQKVQMWVDGVDVTKDRKGDTQDAIVEAFGISDQTFEICTNVGKPELSVVSKQSSWRVSYLMELFKLDDLDGIGSVIANEVEACKRDLMTAATAKATADTNLEVYRKDSASIKEPDQFELIGLNERKTAINTRMGAITQDVNGQVAKLQQEQHTINLSYQGVQSSSAAVGVVERNIATFETSLANAKTALTTFETNAASNTCPTCHQHVEDGSLKDHVKLHQDNVANIQKQLDDEKAKLPVAKKEYDDKKVAHDTLVANRSVDQSAALRAEHAQLTTEYTDIDTKTSTIEQQVAEYNRIGAVGDMHLSSQVVAAVEVAHAHAIQAFWDMVNTAINVPDIKMRVVSSVSKFLNEKATYYLTKIFGSTVGVVCDASLKVTSNKTMAKFDIYVTRKTKQVPFEQYSGGERGSVRIAVDLAMSELVASTCAARFKFLVFDEAFDKLDLAKADAVTELIKDVKMTRGISFSVLHVMKPTSAFDMTLRVEKRGEYSTVTAE